MDIYKIDDMLFESIDVAIEWYKQGGWEDHADLYATLVDVVLGDDSNLLITWRDEDDMLKESTLFIEFADLMVKAGE